ncbi:related to MNN4 Regulates the mannosylphosphorylation [Phialocephala subalpina]|uniref:Related to MNN4 Regulates the mannosylphosphorylation n=1 Tax=Phialocephala subalpina TaxID=576137 RepID=A0A1L7WFL4_9HELO|nr:related to MNN4 Regulates the mannosylphosphorylation [Phialocephala subalpina]
MLSKQRLWIYVPLVSFALICLLFYSEALTDLHIPTSLNSFDISSDAPLHSDAELTASLSGIGEKIIPPGSFDGLYDLCNTTQWQPGLWLHCHSFCGANRTSICGGLNNARNRVQTCLRLAIDAGAGLIIPSATTRDKLDHMIMTDDRVVCADEFWNIESLKRDLGEQCPQLVLRMCDDRSGIQTVVESDLRSYLNPSYSLGGFREHIESLFEGREMVLEDVSVENPVVVNFGDAYLGWNYRTANEFSTIRKALFKVLKFNQELLDLGAKISKSERLNNGAYIGVHLRGEVDWPASFGSADDQMRLYSEEILRIQNSVSYDISTVYVSCGDQPAIQRFRDILAPLNFTVVDKSILLSSSPDILAQVNALAFDQKAIIEYQTLVDARYWMGLTMSSMSALIAYARTINNTGDLFDEYVYPGSSKNGLNRYYKGNSVMKGDRWTKLMIVNGVDIMDTFP